MPKRDREKCVVILGLLALALPGMAHAAPRPASPHGLARVFAPAVGDPQVLSLPPSVWPAGAPSLINRAITAADADVESAFRVGTVFHRRTYAAGGMQGGFYQVDTGARNTAWLGSFYGSAAQATAMAADVTAGLRSEGSAVAETAPCLAQAPTCSRFSFTGTSGTGEQAIVYAVWHEGNVLGELMVESPAAAGEDLAAFDSLLTVAVDTVHRALTPPQTATATPAPTRTSTPTPTPRPPTATPTATQPPPSISVDAAAILHRASGGERATRTLQMGETARFVVAYAGANLGTAAVAATVQLAMTGKPFGPPLPLLTAATYRGKPALEGRIRTVGMAAGIWRARFRVTAGPAAAARDLSFKLVTGR